MLEEIYNEVSKIFNNIIRLYVLNTKKRNTAIKHKCLIKQSFTYLASQPVGVKSNLCLVLNIKFLVLISSMDGG